MSSGFVPAGSKPPEDKSNDEWARAQQQVAAARKAKPAEKGVQEGGKSLFEHLQANKAAKQEAFEEAAKLRNQFRALDDSEVEFLDSIRQKEQADEAAVRQNNAEQLEAFRKERAMADRLAIEKNLDTEKLVLKNDSNLSWNSTKKRRRVVEGEKGSESKSRKTSTGRSEDVKPDVQAKTTNLSVSPRNIAADAGVPEERLRSNNQGNETKPSALDIVTQANMGLDVYGSDDDD